MKSKKMFTETVEFQILQKLPGIFEGVAGDTHTRILGMFGVAPTELNDKMWKEHSELQKISSAIILSSIGREDIQIFSDEQVKLLEKALKISLQKSMSITDIFDHYPEEVKKIESKKTQWMNKYEKASKNIISLAKGDKFTHVKDLKDEVKPTLIKPI